MTLLIGKRYRNELSESLGAQGIDVFWIPDCPSLDARLAAHADLMVFLSGQMAVAAEGIYPHIVNYLTNRGYTVKAASGQGPVYPADAGLCVCCTGRYDIFDPKTAHPMAAALLDGIPVRVAQGYARCAVCVVDKQSIVTSDPGVSRAAKTAGMDVLQICPGHIALDGYEYGFIGGASFKLNENTVAFTGTLDGHPDRERIFAFLASHGQKPVILTDRPIFDIGGAIALP